MLGGATTFLDVLRIKNEDIRHFDTAIIGMYPSFPEKAYRSALARADSLRARVKRKKKFVEPAPTPVDRGFFAAYMRTLKP